MIELARLTWPEAARLARDPRSVVLLPLGAIEEHGPHLPLLVDWLGAEALARRLAPRLRRAGYTPILIPPLPYGVSPLAESWSGTVSLRIGTLRTLIVEVVGALAGHGFRRFVLANYQADPDHLRAIAQARRRLHSRRLQLLVAGFSPDPGEQAVMVHPRVRALLRSPRPEHEWHSGEMETALVLSLDSRLVRRAVVRRLPPRWVDWQAKLRAGARSFREIVPGGQGYVGWPAAARAATGRRALALRTALIAKHLVHALDTWPGVAARRASRRIRR